MGLDPLGVPRNNNQIRVITLIEIKAKLIQVAKLYSNLLGSTIQMHVWQCMENQLMLVNVLLVNWKVNRWLTFDFCHLNQFGFKQNYWYLYILRFTNKFVFLINLSRIYNCIKSDSPKRIGKFLLHIANLSWQKRLKLPIWQLHWPQLFPAARGWPIHKMGLDPPGDLNNNNKICVITLI